MEFPIAEPPTLLLEPPPKNETVVKLLRSFKEDTDFRNYVPRIMENAPSAVQDIENHHTGIGSDKFNHTKRTLQLLDTSNLSEQSKFVARASMLFHDCDPGRAIEDLNAWVEAGQITNAEAIDIMKQVWWHDILGIDVNKGFNLTNQLSRVIPTQEEREINLSILEADISSYGLQERYKPVIEQAELLTDRPLALTVKNVREARLLDAHPSLQPPGENDIFVHSIFARNFANPVDKITPLSLMNILVNNGLKSTSRISNLEINKITSYFESGGAAENGLNVFKFQPGNFPNEIGPFGQNENTWMSFVLFGRDIKDSCLTKPLSSAEKFNYVAELINRFDGSGKVIGAEIPLQSAYFFIKPEAADSLIPLLKLEALREEKDPNEWIQERVIIHSGSDIPADLISQLHSGQLNIQEHNTKVMLDNLRYRGITYFGEMKNYFDLINIDGKIEKNSDQPAKDDFVCQVVSEDECLRAASSLSKYVKAFPWLDNDPQVLAFEKKVQADKAIIDNIYEARPVDSNGLSPTNAAYFYFDQENHTLYLNSQSFSTVMIPEIKTFSQEMEKRKTIWNIELLDGKKITIERGISSHPRGI